MTALSRKPVLIELVKDHAMLEILVQNMQFALIQTMVLTVVVLKDTKEMVILDVPKVLFAFLTFN